MTETVRTLDGEIADIRDRISSSGDTVVEVMLITTGSQEKCLAYAEKAKVLQGLHAKMKGLASRSGATHIRDLHVRVEISGFVKNQSVSGDLIVTGIRIAT